jgi:hypothetical protein
VFITLPEITRWGNPYSQRVCPSPVFPRLVQRDFSAKFWFLVRPSTPDARLRLPCKFPPRGPPFTWFVVPPWGMTALSQISIFLKVKIRKPGVESQ